MNTHWRSRDAYKAAFMNAFALTDLQRRIAGKIAERTGRPVRVGRYADISDSFHVYGSYFGEFRGFLSLVEKRSFEDRTWPSAYAEPMFAEARERLKKEKEAEAKNSGNRAAPESCRGIDFRRSRKLGKRSHITHR